MLLDTFLGHNKYLLDEYINLMMESLLPILRHIILSSLANLPLLRDLNSSFVRETSDGEE